MDPAEVSGRQQMLPIELGAETPLFCATQPLAKGVYVHNTLGEVALEGDDPGADRAGAERLWDVCAALCRAHEEAGQPVAAAPPRSG